MVSETKGNHLDQRIIHLGDNKVIKNNFIGPFAKPSPEP